MSLVLWSGGCDSTLVLYDLAVKEGTRDRPVRALTVKHSMVNAWREQAAARKRILARFEQLGLHVACSQVDLTFRGRHWPTSPMGQATAWVAIAALMVEDKERLYTGHHEGDSMWLSWSNLSYAFQQLCSAGGKNDVRWETPLFDVRKRGVIERLRKAKLHRLCWWCEHPRGGKPCGGCAPCRAHELALHEMRRWPDEEKRA